MVKNLYLPSFNSLKYVGISCATATPYSGTLCDRKRKSFKKQLIEMRMAGGGRRERRRMVAPGGPKGGKKLVVC